MLTDAASPSDLTRFVLSQALELGFHAVAVTTPQPLTPEDDRLRQWLTRGYHADMDWMARYFDLRVDPRALMPDVCAIVCVLMAHDREDPGNSNPDGVAIARYARGTDYHRVVKRRLKDLLRAIQSRAPHAKGRAFTDSAPVLEKALAARAGLGWIGKNGLLIHRDLGSYCFLGELFLTIELDATEAPTSMASFCGRCTRCLEACPTQAIVSPGVVDANRCIAYWTIEYQGETLPPEIAQNLNGWAFGCDICQEVCPWNARALKRPAPEITPEFAPRPWNRAPLARDLMALTPQDFADRYRHSPIKRTGLAALQRNARAAAPQADGTSRPGGGLASDPRF